MFGALNNTTDEMNLGSSPYGEDCAQVGSSDYERMAKEECGRYKKQLETQFPDKPEGVSFIVKGFPHDFGRYYEVIVRWNTDNEEAEQYAYEVESNLPEKWIPVKTEQKKAGPVQTAEWVGGEDEALAQSTFDEPIFVMCPYCEQEREMEVDASGLCECENCRKMFNIDPLI